MGDMGFRLVKFVRKDNYYSIKLSETVLYTDLEKAGLYFYGKKYKLSVFIKRLEA